MVRKIIIFGLVALGAVIFYKKFMADTLNPFFGNYKRDIAKAEFSHKKIPKYDFNE